MEKKITKKAMFETLLTISEVAENSELVAFITHEIELLTKKSNGKKKLTPTQEANEVFKTLMIDYLKNVAVTHTIRELQEAIPELAELSNQRMSRLLNTLVEKKVLIKVYVKRTVYFGYNFDATAEQVEEALEPETEE